VIELNDTRKPDKHRLLNAFQRKESDRVPNWELGLMRRNAEAIIGKERIADVERRYRACETAWPARSEPEENDRSALVNNSCYLPAEEQRLLLERTGQDAIACTLSWKPKSRRPEYKGVVARGQEGIVQGRADLSKLPAPPGVSQMMIPLDLYVSAFKGTGIGVGVLVRSVFCNTYETLGMENFMLKMYDDPGIIEILFDKFMDYSVQITRAAVEREVDFLILDDDLCDNNGFLVAPGFIHEQWRWRTRLIIQPFLSKGLPVVYHCCGNLRSVIPLAIELGISAVHPIQPTCNNIYDYKKQYGRDMSFMGNIDLAGVLTRGTPGQVREDTREHIAALSTGGGYVVASSHSITDDVPPENYKAMIETAWQNGRD
jgi:uroporphyrinogen decarboxylase